MQDPIGNCVGFRLAAAHRRLDRLFNKMYEPIGLAHAHAQILISLAATLWIMDISPDQMSTHLAIPFVKEFLSNLGWFYVGFAIFVMVGASNAVNLTDGLDGLAIGSLLIAWVTFSVLTYAAGLHAVTIVWIAARFTDEHRAALDWLNEVTDDTLRFFGLEVELWLPAA